MHLLKLEVDFACTHTHTHRERERNTNNWAVCRKKCQRTMETVWQLYMEPYYQEMTG